MRDRILRFLRSSSYRPMNKSELARALEVSSNERADMRGVLAKLEREGVIVAGKKSRYELRGKKQGILVGRISFLRKGGAFFYPDTNDEQNLEGGLDLEKYKRIFISSKNSSTALDGDKVAVEILREGPPVWHKYAKGKKGRGGKGQPGKQMVREQGRRGHDDEDMISGRVVKIIERKTVNTVGVYFERGKFSYVQPDDTLLPPTMEVANSGGAKPGQKVALKLISWDNPWDTPVGEIVEVLGWPDDPGVDIISVIRRYGLRVDFPEDVQVQAGAAHAEGVPEAEVERREDWRDRIVITIDPWDAKDHDDAVAVKKLDDGWELAVHIADVSHYVREYSELDKEAQLRGNSTYLVDRVLPMLPELLSNDICSLKPHVDRLTKCAVIQISSKGEIKDFRLCDAVIHSQYKLSYEQAQEILDNDATGEVEDLVKEAWRMAAVLRRRRFANGSLDLEFPEIKVVLDELGKPIRVDQLKHTESHQLIEECMLIANECVALALKRSRRNAIYRIHENPDLDKLEDFAETARAHGFRVGDLSNKDHVQKLIKEIKGHPSEQAVKIALLKSLKRAVYSAEGLGHYGLGKMDYCHFTSPIRRYADLVVHRAIQSILSNPPAQPAKTHKLAVLEQSAQHISDTERNSAAAETETKKMKLMEYFWLMLTSPNPPEIDCIITECRKMGAFVEMVDYQERALVKKEDFPRGNWEFDNAQQGYIAGGGRKIQLGQKVKAKLVKVDIERQMIDLRITQY